MRKYTQMVFFVFIVDRWRFRGHLWGWHLLLSILGFQNCWAPKGPGCCHRFLSLFSWMFHKKGFLWCQKREYLWSLWWELVLCSLHWQTGIGFRPIGSPFYQQVSSMSTFVLLHCLLLACCFLFYLFYILILYVFEFISQEVLKKMRA